MSDILTEAQENLRQEEAAAAAIGGDQPRNEANFETATENPSARIGDLLPDLSFLLAPTGSGAIEDYIDHPLNSQRSKGLAQILRGCTGICGQLDYAIIDIALGAINYRQEMREATRGETINRA